MMRRFPIPVAVWCVLVPCTGPACALAAQPSALSVTIGGFPRTLPHCSADVFSLEYERGYSARNALVLRASGVPYRFDDSYYQERGHLRGVDIGARHYRGAEGAGLYMGASLGYWTSDWSFIHAYYPALPQGTGQSRSLRLNLELGDRIVFGNSGFFVAPQVNLGKFFSSQSCTYTGPASYVGTACTRKSEVTGYWFVGLGAGVMF